MSHKPKRVGRMRGPRRYQQSARPLVVSADSTEPVRIVINIHNLPSYIPEQSPLLGPSVVATIGRIPSAEGGQERNEELKRAFREHVELWKTQTQH
jgi:hypothetical protein